ncbi:TM2 domain-containing protein [Marinomonas sp. THO17]|uniref:TM2 domain-containing protein n=1 Tax=Marinomonas sp. THO17 TaxID=3149048 RepID=UPI00336BB99B
MKGKILLFDDSSRTGIISGDDGKRYEFDIEQWRIKSFPSVDMRVDFIINESFATTINPNTNPSKKSSSKKMGAILFAFLLGAFGAHKFYLGYKMQGVIMLLTSIIGYVFIGIPTLIMMVIAFIECVIYIFKSNESFEETYILNNRGWF